MRGSEHIPAGMRYGFKSHKPTKAHGLPHVRRRLGSGPRPTVDASERAATNTRPALSNGRLRAGRLSVATGQCQCRNKHDVRGDAMASSRTGSAIWKRVVTAVRERDAHINNCPLCDRGLDWLYSKRPNSAEVDHIIPHAQGGEDSVSNARIICRHCNQSRGGREGRAKQAKPKRIQLQTKTNW